MLFTITLCYLQLCYSRLFTTSNFFAFYQTFLSIGHSVSGEYTVKDPGGSLRIVSYHADKEGFHAVVHTSGKNDHSGGVYGGQGHEETGHLHEYAALSAHAAAYWKRTGSRHDQPWLIAFVPGTIRLFLSRIVIRWCFRFVYQRQQRCCPSDITRRDNVSYIHMYCKYSSSPSYTINDINMMHVYSFSIILGSSIAMLSQYRI